MTGDSAFRQHSGKMRQLFLDNGRIGEEAVDRDQRSDRGKNKHNTVERSISCRNGHDPVFSDLRPNSSSDRAGHGPERPLGSLRRRLRPASDLRPDCQIHTAKGDQQIGRSQANRVRLFHLKSVLETGRRTPAHLRASQVQPALSPTDRKSLQNIGGRLLHAIQIYYKNSSRRWLKMTFGSPSNRSL